jgi:hypothetical protein
MPKAVTTAPETGAAIANFVCSFVVNKQQTKAQKLLTETCCTCVCPVLCWENIGCWNLDLLCFASQLANRM